MVANIERGERQIGLIEFIAIARALGVDERVLFGCVIEAIGKTVEI
jgi:hypothetical protein